MGGVAAHSTTICWKLWQITAILLCASISVGMATPAGRSDLSLWAADMAAAAAVLMPVTDKIWAAGQSTGGTMSLIAAATQECFAGAVSLAPFCTLQDILRDNSESKSILEARFGPLQEKDFRAADAMAVTRGMAKPVLLIHGTGDETVPVAHGMRLAESIGEVVRFVPIDGGNHHLRNVDRNAIIKEITDWLISH